MQDIRPANAAYVPSEPLMELKFLEEERKRTLTDEQYKRGEGALRFLEKSLREEEYQRGKGQAVFLRRIDSGEKDEVVYDLSIGVDSICVSPDAKHLVFVHSGRGAAPDTFIGLLEQGQSMRQMSQIAWPRFDLVPSTSPTP